MRSAGSLRCSGCLALLLLWPPASGSGNERITPGPTNAAPGSLQERFVRLEHEWARMVIEKDVAALERLLADDWVALGLGDPPLTKAAFVADVRAGRTATQSVHYGPMQVRVYGQTAVVTGSHTEVATFKGHNSTGRYIWTDVFVQQSSGVWQLVVSQYTKYPPAGHEQRVAHHD